MLPRQRQYGCWGGKMANFQWSARVFLPKTMLPTKGLGGIGANMATAAALSSDLCLQPGQLATCTQNCRRILLLNSYWYKLSQMTIIFPNLSDLGRVSKVTYLSGKCHHFCVLKIWIKIWMRVAYLNTWRLSLIAELVVLASLANSD